MWLDKAALAERSYSPVSRATPSSGKLCLWDTGAGFWQVVLVEIRFEVVGRQLQVCSLRNFGFLPFEL